MPITIWVIWCVRNVKAFDDSIRPLMESLSKIKVMMHDVTQDFSDMHKECIMSCHLTLFLAYFLVIFSRFFIQNKGVLEQLITISVGFYNFFSHL